VESDPSDWLSEELRTGEHHLPLPSDDEMRARLRALQDELTALELTLQREREAGARAERERQRSSQLLGSLAHELRNPLSSISGWLQLISTGKIEQDTRRRAMASMARSLRLLTRTVEDFGDYARCVDGSMTLSAVLVSPAVLLGHALRENRALAEQRGVALSCEIDPELPELLADPCRLVQVFELVISSALRATPRCGAVLVCARRDGPRVRISVRDGGERAAEPAVPVLRSLSAAESGSSGRGLYPGPALGLQLARHLVELQRGSLSIEGTEERPRFDLSVPLPV
jgi:signal transduction histidine kinase